MNLRKETKPNREKAIKKLSARIKKLMNEEPTISVDTLVMKTGHSEYTIKNIYMKLRRGM